MNRNNSATIGPLRVFEFLRNSVRLRLYRQNIGHGDQRGQGVYEFFTPEHAIGSDNGTESFRKLSHDSSTESGGPIGARGGGLHNVKSKGPACPFRLPGFNANTVPFALNRSQTPRSSPQNPRRVEAQRR